MADTILGFDGNLIVVGDRVSVNDGPHQGGGVVDAVDLDAKKVWVKFDPAGTAFTYIFWVDAIHTKKA